MTVKSYDSPYPHGDDPERTGRRVRRILGRLRYVAGVNVEVPGDGSKDSAALLREGNFQPVIDDLIGRRDADDGVRNNLGCAYAWAHVWHEARVQLESSGAKEAEENRKVVAEAERAGM